MVSIRVWDGKSLHLVIKVSLMAVHKAMYKKCRDVCFSMVSFKGQFKFGKRVEQSIMMPKSKILRLVNLPNGGRKSNS